MKIFAWVTKKNGIIRIWYLPQIPMIYAANTFDICRIYEI